MFYNPVQEFNRDMSIACIKTWYEAYAEEWRTKREKALSNKKRKTSPVNSESVQKAEHEQTSENVFV